MSAPHVHFPSENEERGYLQWLSRASSTFCGTLIALIIFGICVSSYMEYKVGLVAAKLREIGKKQP